MCKTPFASPRLARNGKVIAVVGLRGKRICVTGKISDYHGKPEIVLTDPRQLAIPFLKRFTSPIPRTVKICDRYPEHLAR